jgi:hypothetical protein
MGMKPIPILAFHWLPIILLCGLVARLAGCSAAPSSITSRDQPSDKTFLNLTLPGDTQFTPMVVEATPERAVVTRVSRNPSGDHGRVIQVLAGRDDQWEFVGDRGDALLGEQQAYPFLSDVRRDAQGNLWVLATKNRQERGVTTGFTLHLLRLDGETWKEAGPALQSEGMLAWNPSLHFTGEGTPFIVYGVAGGKGRALRQVT